VMGNMCDRLDRVERRGKETSTKTQDVRNVGIELKANSGSRAERPCGLIGGDSIWVRKINEGYEF